MADEKVTLMERLDPADLEYHQTVVKQSEAAQQIANFWTQHLSRRYNLQQGDKVEINGRIIRASRPNETKKDEAKKNAKAAVN